MIRNFKILIILSIITIYGCDQKQYKPVDNSIKFEKSELVISGLSDHKFIVELADNNEKRKHGLMFRRELADNEGMLFNFEETTTIAMWMQNTYIPLDMIFIYEDGVIADIVENTTPLSENIIAPSAPVYSVLELKSGAVRKFGIKIGDKVHHNIFKNI